VPSLVWQTVRPLRRVMRTTGVLFVQIGHDLHALLERNGIVFVLAGRRLNDEIRLTRNVASARGRTRGVSGCWESGVIV
jgi:hypothetical protein